VWAFCALALKPIKNSCRQKAQQIRVFNLIRLLVVYIGLVMNNDNSGVAWW